MKNMVFKKIIFFVCLLGWGMSHAIEEKSMVIIIPSYNNAQWYKRNIGSALAQQYKNFRVIYIDDCSPDKTGELVQKYLEEYKLLDRVTLIRNSERHGAMYNLYHAIHSCADHEIIVTLDGDDFLAHDQVLKKLNETYSSADIWLTYGQFVEYPSEGKGWCAAMPFEIIRDNQFRQTASPVSHLRTFYAWLFKKIKQEDLMLDGEFYKMTWDKAMMWPMLEMCGDRFRFIPDVLYIYNASNPINDHKVDQELQFSLHRHIQNMELYQPIKTRTDNIQKVGLLITAVGDSIKFVAPLIASARKHFCTKHEVTYFVFTDGEVSEKADDIIVLPWKRNRVWGNLLRVLAYHNHLEKLRDMDYLFSCDPDLLFIDTLGDEILTDLVGMQYPSYVGKCGEYEQNAESSAYVLPRENEIYFAQSFFGGSTSQVISLIQQLLTSIGVDAINNIIAGRYEESYLNRYFIDHQPLMIVPGNYFARPFDYQKKLSPN